jgi:glycerophosphoryl diester phosphodiesterase
VQPPAEPERATDVDSAERNAVTHRRPLSGFAVMGHRGAPNEVPENTIESIVRAFDVGADIVEVDVRRSRDGVLFLFHDGELERTSDGEGAPEALSMDELKRLDAGSWMGARFTGLRIPTLAEALAIAKGRGRLLLDLKNDGMGAAVERLLRESSLPGSMLLIGAWTPTQAADFREHVPDATLLASYNEPWPPEESLATFQARGIEALELGFEPDPELVEAAHSRGMPVYCYTVNREDAMRRLIAIGVDGIETDEPRLLVDIVRQLTR